MIRQSSLFGATRVPRPMSWAYKSEDKVGLATTMQLVSAWSKPSVNIEQFTTT